QSLVWLKIAAWCLATNKLLKRDSQRVAFSLCVELSDSGGLRRLRYCVAHPLAGRYMKKERLWLKIEKQGIVTYLTGY
ncbi:hypothetical protein ACP54H_004632, partial [Vibrio alginolyticus]